MPSLPTKDAARQAVWDALHEEGAARFPYPPHGRIPNFLGAQQAAERLLGDPAFDGVRAIKANPDAPQRPLRLGALRRGITVYMPTPRLRAGFYRLDPERIPTASLKQAASLSGAPRWAESVPLEALENPIDLVITGSVAVTPSGRRCGKGHGYGDLEYALLRELGHPAIPVATTVHPLQMVPDFPADPHDLPVSVIALPEQILRVPQPPQAPDGIRWADLPHGALEEIPFLAQLARQRDPS